MFMAQYCPHTATCPFYQRWDEQTKNKGIYIDINTRRNVIVTKSEEGNLYYDCRALMALNVSETKPKQREVECSHITLLNLLVKLDKILK